VAETWPRPPSTLGSGRAITWFPKEIFMKDEKRGSTTRMIMSEVKFDTNLSDQIFTVRNLTSF
jgi:outer membrane lipoprotein-sorting protein